MQGTIWKGIAGFYYVDTVEAGVYACKAKGIFRKQNIKPLVGDRVKFEVTHEGDKEGNITDILPRKNELIRPAVANVDQAVVIFALSSPDPNFFLLDRFLVSMEAKDIPVVLVFNKEDRVSSREVAEVKALYEPAGYQVIVTSAKKEDGLQELKEVLHGKISTVAGPSGVGKSSLINLIVPDAEMETGEISHKIDRGKHTTRHSQLLKIEEGTYIMDTPGFTSLFLQDMEKEDLGYYFPEFASYSENCRFRGCSHINEPGCCVKDAVEEKKIPKLRYSHYLEIYQELKDQKKY